MLLNSLLFHRIHSYSQLFLKIAINILLDVLYPRVETMSHTHVRPGKFDDRREGTFDRGTVFRVHSAPTS